MEKAFDRIRDDLIESLLDMPNFEAYKIETNSLIGSMEDVAASKLRKELRTMREQLRGFYAQLWASLITTMFKSEKEGRKLIDEINNSSYTTYTSFT